MYFPFLSCLFSYSAIYTLGARVVFHRGRLVQTGHFTTSKTFSNIRYLSLFSHEEAGSSSTDDN